MALLKRELRRQIEGQDVTQRDLWTLVFDTDSKRLYVEHEWTYTEMRQGDVGEHQKGVMDIAEYLMQGGQTAGHRELWRLLQMLFRETSDPDDFRRLGAPGAEERRRRLGVST